MTSENSNAADMCAAIYLKEEGEKRCEALFP